MHMLLIDSKPSACCASACLRLCCWLVRAAECFGNACELMLTQALEFSVHAAGMLLVYENRLPAGRPLQGTYDYLNFLESES